MDFLVNSEKETENLGKQIGVQAKPGDIICLNGDLGCGKTYFTKGIALGLGIKDYITSPTFTIVNEYLGRLKLNHFDVYRVHDIEEIALLGFDEYIFSEAVTVIEWSNLILELLPKDTLEIDIKKEPQLGDNYRRIHINPSCGKYDYVTTLHTKL
ncbi:MAG TPA: tRNA (adenosine(37)-N6)-threonylcarbamoyltransferase complex ATPase subunit type 1 TsaE [Clostridiaceae bacterium]